MSIIVSALIVMSLLGVTFGIGLAIASRRLAVEVDPRIEQVSEALPGLNCGACGYAQCAAYAEALVKSEAQVGLCSPGGEEVASLVGTILGLKVEIATPRVAVLRCHRLNCPERYHYDGLDDCRGAELLQAGFLACHYGCLGLGTCVEACQFEALVMGKDGLPQVMEENCVACGACVRVCPRNLFTLESISDYIHVRCSSHDRGALSRKVCERSCIVCRLCERECPVDAITMVHNLAVIDQEKCIRCGRCVQVCPNEVIVDFRLARGIAIERDHHEEETELAE